MLSKLGSQAWLYNNSKWSCCPLEVTNNVSQLNGNLYVWIWCAPLILFKFYSGIAQPRHYHNPQHITLQAEDTSSEKFPFKKINK